MICSLSSQCIELLIGFQETDLTSNRDSEVILNVTSNLPVPDGWFEYYLYTVHNTDTWG